MRFPSSYAPLSFGLIACVIGACSDSTTDPPPNETILGSWKNVAFDTIDVIDDTGAILGKTLLISTTTLHLEAGGTLTSRLRWEYDPQFASAKDTELTRTGTWRVSGDTLFRETWPEGFGSKNTSTYSITANVLTLRTVMTGYTVSYERIE